MNIGVGGSPGIFIPTGSVGYDTGSGSFTAWSSNNGVQFVNNGQMFLAYVNGGTVCTASILIGAKAGGAVPLYSTYQTTLAATSGPGWLPPLSPAGFNQQDSSQHSGAPAGVIGSAGVGMTCIDFSAITTLGVRLYQLIPVSP
jgi:hypothetical protein